METSRMSHYDEVLTEARSKASNSAKEYIPKLYNILVDEENKTQEDARKIIEHDLIEYWSKATVRKFLPQEAKDEQKAIAGSIGGNQKAMVLQKIGNTMGARTDFPNSEYNKKKQQGESYRTPKTPSLDDFQTRILSLLETINDKVDSIISGRSFEGTELEE
jgi:hypothetical protein